MIYDISYLIVTAGGAAAAPLSLCGSLLLCCMVHSSKHYYDFLSLCVNLVFLSHYHTNETIIIIISDDYAAARSLCMSVPRLMILYVLTPLCHYDRIETVC